MAQAATERLGQNPAIGGVTMIEPTPDPDDLIGLGLIFLIVITILYFVFRMFH